MTRLRRFVDETLGGPARASDELAGVVGLVHALVVVGLLSLSWFDGSDLRLLVAARPGSLAAVDEGVPPGAAVLAWLVSLVASFPWWAAVAVLAVLVLLADGALWLLLRALLGTRLRVPLALAAVVGLPLVTAAATDLSVGLSALPALALVATAVALGVRGSVPAAVGAAALGVAATVFHPGAGLVLLVLLLVAPGRARLAAVPPVVATVVWVVVGPVPAPASAAHAAASTAAASLGWPVWWGSTSRGVTSGLDPWVTWVVAAVAVVGVAVLLRRHGRALVLWLLAAAVGGVLAVPGVGPGALAPAVAADTVALACALRTVEVPGPGARRTGLVVLCGLLVASGTASAITLGTTLARDDDTSDYARNVESTARRTGTVRLAATDVPGRVVADDALGGDRRPLTVKDLFARSTGVRVESSGNDLSVANPIGFVKIPDVAGGVRTAAPKPGTCGRLVRTTRTREVARLRERSPRRADWLTIGYLASDDDVVTLELDGVERRVRVLRGSHTYFLDLDGRSVRTVRLGVGTRGSTVCVGSVRRGPLIASEFS